MCHLISDSVHDKLNIPKVCLKDFLLIRINVHIDDLSEKLIYLFLKISTEHK